MAFGANAEPFSLQGLQLVPSEKMDLLPLPASAVFWSQLSCRLGTMTGCPGLWSGPDKLTQEALRLARLPSRPQWGLHPGAQTEWGLQEGQKPPPHLCPLILPGLAQGDGRALCRPGPAPQVRGLRVGGGETYPQVHSSGSMPHTHPSTGLHCCHPVLSCDSAGSSAGPGWGVHLL